MWIHRSLMIIGCLPMAVGHVAAQPDPEAIVAGLARTAPARTPFVEIRFSGLLDRPLISRGELEYRGPAQLSKQVVTPHQELTTIEGSRVTVARAGREPRHFDLQRAPEMEGFLRGFSALLGGDPDALAADFSLASSGNDTWWRLVLTPRDSRLARRIASMEVDGHDDEARCFRTRDADGDVSVMLVGELAATPLPTRPAAARIDGLCRGIGVP